MGEGQSRLLDQGPGPDPPEALTASGPKRRTWIGSGASYCITTNDTQGIESAKRPARLPVVLTRQEVESILAHLSGTVGLMIRLLYGTGMRIMECVRLRVKDVDFTRGEIVVRQGKGGKDRMTMLPQNDAVPL